MARVADNFPLIQEYGFKEKAIYKGTWYPYVRDIDPTILISSTKQDEKNCNNWWFKTNYSNWDFKNEVWMNKKIDFPSISEIIAFKENDENEWLLLDGSPQWREPKEITENSFGTSYKRLWYHIESYIIPKESKNEIDKLVKAKTFWILSFPEAGQRYQVFSREYYWSKAHAFFQKNYYRGEIEVEITDRKDDKLISKAYLPYCNYLWEEEFDCSKEEALRFLKPSYFLFKGLNMKQGKHEGEFVNQENELICFDPSVNNKSLSCLLVKKKPFIKFLKENNLTIFWKAFGEKQILGNYSGKERYARNEKRHYFSLNDNEDLVGDSN